MVLKIEHLTGGYTGIPVIKDINLEIQPGEALGIIGLNGAGKSTTIKHILGLLRPQKGKIVLNSVELIKQPTEFKRQIAYIPEVPVLYEELTLKEHLELTMMSYQLDEKKAWKRANELLKMFRLDDKLDWMPIYFSKGMKQKVMIVTAFLADTDLLVIDEPFTGLDPLAVSNLIDLIKKAVAQKKMILMSTHILADAEQAISNYAVLNNGKIEVIGSLTDIRKHYGLNESDSFDKIYQILNEEQRHA
ncbi:ABC transporter ATP-binding protein [Lactobacillus panisapium]|uniref:ABC transporter ATP-binding protein n=1 Tax=Lactobacillus panisapium TaxID=2012495 RepID=A0ABX8WBJ5_9LACO|nr:MULTISPECIES: ABC transporter ATP-binding protein [Lactobacillus]MCO6531742.1 ABC transporter ATP-binding protein [Lactobacillus sp.]MCO6534175.1 ABC transporter ATP-binding protein [Lactobacillus sp.]MCO6535703.1 ABC transporter ATP-binding protein [Lactobacillus sp.]MCT6853397.1 ABC transporter ATP-binding protein [Lactobacillus panisapium]MCT6865740.1 ABC transporter ATP-binding protein [Lactobacillus panisapium]